MQEDLWWCAAAIVVVDGGAAERACAGEVGDGDGTARAGSSQLIHWHWIDYLGTAY
jgi:hypothetical protein